MAEHVFPSPLISFSHFLPLINIPFLPDKHPSPSLSEGNGGTLGGEGAALLQHPKGKGDPTATLTWCLFQRALKSSTGSREQCWGGTESQSIALPPQGN